jgi:hypothetical protein
MMITDNGSRYSNSSSINGASSLASTKEKNGPVYYYHPKEWWLGIGAFLILAYLRIHHFTYGSWLHAFNNEDFFANDGAPRDVEITMLDVCGVDITLLCLMEGFDLTHDFCALSNWIKLSLDYISLHSGTFSQPQSSRRGIRSCDLKDQVAKMQDEIELMSILARHSKRRPSLVDELTSSESSRLANLDGKKYDLEMTMALLMNIAPHYAPYYNLYTMDEKEKILEFFLVNAIIGWFTPSNPALDEGGKTNQLSGTDQLYVSAIESSKASRMGVTDIVWSRYEIFDLAIEISKAQSMQSLKNPLSSEMVGRVVHRLIGGDLPETGNTDPSREIRTLRSSIMPYTLPKGVHPMVMESIPANVPNPMYESPLSSSPHLSIWNEASKFPRALNEDETAEVVHIKHAYSIFNHKHEVDQCMFSHFDDGILITNTCERAFPAAIAKLHEIDVCPVSTDFIIITQYLSLGINLLSLLMLGFYFSLRDSDVKRMEKMKKQLEQELSDPFLRQSLERKAQTLPPVERDQLIVKLESKLQQWDSHQQGSVLTRSKVARFRHLALFVVVSTLVVGLFLSMYHIESRARFLESLLVSVAIFTLSYAIPIKRTNKNSSGSINGQYLKRVWEDLIAAITGSADTVTLDRRGSTQPPMSSSFSDTQALLMNNDVIAIGDGEEQVGVEMRTV